MSYNSFEEGTINDIFVVSVNLEKFLLMHGFENDFQISLKKIKIISKSLDVSR